MGGGSMRGRGWGAVGAGRDGVEIGLHLQR